MNYWGNLNNQGYNFQAGSNVQDVITAQVNLVFNENSVDEKHETFVVPCAPSVTWCWSRPLPTEASLVRMTRD